MSESAADIKNEMYVKKERHTDLETFIININVCIFIQCKLQNINDPKHEFFWKGKKNKVSGLCV